MKQEPPIDLLEPFRRETVRERIGIEVELAVLDPVTGLSVPYAGPAGGRALLESLACELPGTWQALGEGDVSLSLREVGGAVISLETGGALEYSSEPADSVAELVDAMERRLAQLAAVADRLGLALVSAGNMPFNRPQDTHWIPKRRGQIQRDYFASLGADGSQAWRLMSQTMATQVSLDYLSERDMSDKLHLLVRLTPVLAALFANSPLSEGVSDGTLSYRTRFFRQFDPARAGCIPPALCPELTFADYVDWVLDVPAIFRVVDGIYQPLHGCTFRSALASGYLDGTFPTAQDWHIHLSSLVTDIRLKNVLEVRAIDAPPPSVLPAVPALLTGLVYSASARAAAHALLPTIPLEAYWPTLTDVAALGFKARYGGHLLLDLAREIVTTAHQGLTERVASGSEPSSVLRYLEPLEQRLVDQATFAEVMRSRWDDDQSPARWVEAYRVLS